MAEKIRTLHPEGKQETTIDKAKYDRVRAAILDIVRTSGDVPFGELAPAVGERLLGFEGSIGWYTTTVKLDLEARGEIERVPGAIPQRLRLKS